MLGLAIAYSAQLNLKMKRALPILALFLLGLATGLPLGSYLVKHKFIENEKALGMASEEDTADDFAEKEFIYADPRSARDALQYAINIHREMQDKNPLSGWPERRDLGWCYAELSVIEESEGNTAASAADMIQAQQTLKEAGVKDVSEAHIRALLTRPRDTNRAPEPK